MISIFKKNINISREYNLRWAETLNGISMFIVLLDQDIHFLRRQILRATDYDEQQFVARQLAVLVCDAFEAIPALLGGDFQESLKRLGLLERHTPALNVARKAIAAVRHQYDAELRRIRNAVVAHRVRDASELLNILDSVDPVYVFSIGARFGDALNLIVRVLTQLLLELDIYLLARDLVSKSPEKGDARG